MIAEDWGKLLVQHGFIKEKSRAKYKQKDDGTWIAMQGDTSPSDADMEEAEEANITASTASAFTSYIKTGYPDPYKRYRLIVESPNVSIEENYYWMLNYMRYSSAFPHVEKLTDIFSASEQSAFWGASQSRIGIQQDRAAQYLKGISEMIKTGLFQLVRELRIIDEKLEPRKQWGKNKSADVALKGEYTDLVENRGGQIQPGSVYHLAQNVGFTSLPDLFFNTQVYKLEDVDKVVDDLKFNTNVKHVLRRKLFAFINWKLKTDKELESRRIFTLKYLRQHWNVIKMYMNWVKPYIRNIARLQMSPEHTDSPDLISAFETSMIEVEILAYKESKTQYHPCMVATFKYRTRPELSFQKDQYAHRGPIHVGHLEITLRAYGWRKEQIEAYKKLKKAEDMMLLGMVDEGIKAAMDALGDDLENYLWESGEKEFEEKRKAKEAEEKMKKKKLDTSLALGAMDPFISVFKGMWEMFNIFVPVGAIQRGSGKKKPKGDPKAAAEAVAIQMFLMYKNYKKAHGMLSW